MAAEKDILSTFNNEWLGALGEIKKWDEKKAKMEEVVAAADTPKLANGDYSALFDSLKKMAGDSHAAVSGSGINAIGALAKGLRKGFKDHAKQAVPVLFGKLKEKRLVNDILTCLDNIMLCVELADLIEFLPQIDKETAPASKLNILVFLERAILVTYIDMLEDIKDQICCPPVMKVIEAKDPAGRD